MRHGLEWKHESREESSFKERIYFTVSSKKEKKEKKREKSKSKKSFDSKTLSKRPKRRGERGRAGRKGKEREKEKITVHFPFDAILLQHISY